MMKKAVISCEEAFVQIWRIAESGAMEHWNLQS